VVTYIERDAANTLWVATNSSSAGGKIWMILPVLNSSGDPITSCTTGIVPSSPLVSLKSLTQGRNPLLTQSQTQAVGLAITATSFTPAAKTFTPANPSNTWNFGHYMFTVTYKQVFTTFAQSFTSVMSRPADVTFMNPPFPNGTTGLLFPSLGGFVIQFQTNGSVPIAGTQFASTDATGPAIQVIVAFHDPVQGFRNPGLAHAVSCGPLCPPFTDDLTRDFWVLLDQAMGGDADGWGSRYVTFDEPFVSSLALPLTVTLNEPALSGNPLFNIGQNFTVSITVTDAHGSPVNGLLLRVSAARITPGPIALQTVQATNSSTHDNVMNNNGNGKYSIGVDTGIFTGGTGTYQFTIFGQGFSPFVFNARFQK
jgi:hypothetical protein